MRKDRLLTRSSWSRSPVQRQVIIGHTGSPFAGKKLGVLITSNTQSIKFEKTLFHPNVAADGGLSFQKKRGQPYTLAELVSIAEKLLSTPDLNPALVVNKRAAQLYVAQPYMYFKLAKVSAE